MLGSSGSIGVQTLEVIDADPGAYRVAALAVGRSSDVIAQAARYRPDVVAISDEVAAAEIRGQLPAGIEVLTGPDALAHACEYGDVVVNGVVGFAGLPVTVRTLELGKRLALANKESLIAGGPVVRRALGVPGAEIVPVDSEHCAVHQCLRAGASIDEVSRIILTASGGPFRGRSAAELADVTVAEALDHPTWSMGPKITIDSSTLMNKGLEVIEAHELFGVAYDQIDVVVHPQSIVHSMVEFTDGATIAQLSMPDMRLPIAYALAYPQRSAVGFGHMDFTAAQTLTFEPPDRDTFRCLDLAYAAGALGETAPATLSAANEVAVEAFLAGGLRWPQIATIVEATLSQWDGTIASDVDAVVDADHRARALAAEIVRKETL